MTGLTSQIRQLRDVNEQFLRAAMRSAQETMAGLDAETGTYDARGTSGAEPSSAHFFDASL